MFLIISTTTNNKDVADSISENILKNKLSPCVNISPKITSKYFWNNELKKDDEYVLSIKTINALKEEVINTIKNNHNYEIPEIISTKIDILSNEYKEWFKESLKI